MFKAIFQCSARARFIWASTALSVLIAVLWGCQEKAPSLEVPTEEGRYLRIVRPTDTNRYVLEAYIVRNGKTRYVAAELNEEQLVRRKAFPLASNATVFMGPCGPVLWSPPINVLNATTWQSSRQLGFNECPIPFGTATWRVLNLE